MAELKNRSEMDKSRMWKLSDIIKDAAEFDALYEETRKMADEYSKLAGKVKEDPRKAIRDLFKLEYNAEKLYVYAHMHKDEDGMNNEALVEAGRTQQLSVEVRAKTSFLQPELLDMAEAELQALIDDPEMRDYDVFVKDVLRSKPHSLPAEQEKLMAMAGEVRGTAQEAFGALNNVDLPLPKTLNEQGEMEQLTPAGYGRAIKSRDRAVRADAFKGMMNAYKAFGATITALYAGSVKGDRFDAQVRHFNSCREQSLFPDQIPLEVYDGLIDSVHEALPTLNEYLGIRKELLKLDELHLYDLYVPIIENFDMEMTYDQAFDLVIEGLKPLGEDYQGYLKEARENGWVDVYENKNKRGGAYSWGVYGTHPYVLLNHTDDLGGMTTLAHELGHAMHSLLSNRNQPFAKAGYSLFVAEVASTCNEVLMMRHLLKKYADNKVAKAFICNQLLEEFRTTVFRQTMFAEFEKNAHAMLESGEPLTMDSLSKMYYGLNEAYYGSACKVDEEISSEWMRIPHFYGQFYVYKYATGFSCAVAIADRILKLGDEAVEDYKKFLSAGGSVPPIEALKLAGVDISKPETVKSALNVFKETVDTLKECLK